MRLTHQSHIRRRFRNQVVQLAHAGCHVTPDAVVAVDVLGEEGVAGVSVGRGGGGRGELATGWGDGVFQDGGGTEGGGSGEGLEGVGG